MRSGLGECDESPEATTSPVISSVHEETWPAPGLVSSCTSGTDQRILQRYLGGGALPHPRMDTPGRHTGAPHHSKLPPVTKKHTTTSRLVRLQRALQRRERPRRAALALR